MNGDVVRKFSVLLILPFLVGACASAEPNRGYRQKESKGLGRDVYSPHIRTDPYVQAQWEASVRSLEARCARAGQYCAEASKARDAMGKLPRAR
jgi:hypothetical protein